MARHATGQLDIGVALCRTLVKRLMPAAVAFFRSIDPLLDQRHGSGRL
jgi:hypothetical protein